MLYRVPLIIHHPQSPYKGQHYTHPVESIDVYPTLVDLLRLQYTPEVCSGQMGYGDSPRNVRCHELQGKSLAPVVLGVQLYNQAVTERTAAQRMNFQRMQMADPIVEDVIFSRYRKWSSSLSHINVAPHISERFLRGSRLGFTVVPNFNNTLASLPSSVTVTPPYPPRVGASEKNVDRGWVLFNERQDEMPVLQRRFAITQSWRCAKVTSAADAGHWHRSYSNAGTTTLSPLILCSLYT